MSNNDAVKLHLKGMGHPPSFKNTKQIRQRWGVVKGQKKQIPFIGTDPKKAKWMEQATHSMKSQLRSLYQTNETETLTGRLARSLIVSCVPLKKFAKKKASRTKGSKASTTAASGSAKKASSTGRSKKAKKEPKSKSGS